MVDQQNRETIIDDCTKLPLGFLIKWAGLTLSVVALCLTALSMQRQAHAVAPNTLSVEFGDARYMKTADAKYYITREEYDKRNAEMRENLKDLLELARDNNKLLADHLNRRSD